MRCSFCDATATHLPKVRYDRLVRYRQSPVDEVGVDGRAPMAAVVFKPVCAEHRSPIVETYVDAVTRGSHLVAYQHNYKELDGWDDALTQVSFVGLASPEARKFLRFREQHGRGQRATVNVAEAEPARSVELPVEIVPPGTFDGEDGRGRPN